MADLVALKAELDSDPLTRGYAGMTDTQASTDLNTVYRDAPPNLESVLDFMFSTTHTTGGAGDVAVPLYGRMAILASATAGDNVWDLTTPSLADNRDIGAAKALVRILAPAAGETFNWNGTTVDTLLDICRTYGCWSVANNNSLKAFSQNQQTRAQELGLGIVREGTVAAARAL